MITEIGVGEFNLWWDSNEGLVSLKTEGLISSDYTPQEMIAILKEMITELEVLL
ncbi:MAG: hypothetical protein RR959_06020 [Erysipelotrichaceae bacterium]